MENKASVPGANPRPGRARRSVVYSAFSRTGPAQPDEGTRPIYLYLRLSKYHKDKADAIERQRLDLCRKLAVEGGWTVMGEYIDNDSASASAAKNRKGWQQLNVDIQAGRVRAVAFWKLDRTNRIAAKCIEWIGECQRSGVYLVSHQDSAEELNTATASAKLMTGLKALLAEVETDSMSERQLAAKRHLAEAGFHHGGQVPLGWMVGPRVTDKFGRSGVRLVPHPVEHPALKDAVEHVLAGKSLRQIARHWKDKYGITTAADKLVYEATIHRALVSPRMIGYRMRQVPEHKRGVKVDLLDYVARDSEGEPVVSQEPVCDRRTWLRVRKLLEEAKTSHSHRPWGSYEWLLSGLIHCPCGQRLYGHRKIRVSRRGVRTEEFAYRCTANRRHGAGTCTVGCAVEARQAEAFVLGWFFAQLSDEALDEARARRRAAQSDEHMRALLAQLDDAVAERDALLSKQGSASYRGSMVTVLLALIEDAQARIDGLQRRIDGIELDAHAIPNGPGLIASWEQLEIMEKRANLRRLIHRVDAIGGRAPVQERLTITPLD